MELNTTLLPIVDLGRTADGSTDIANFAKDVAAGLGRPQKSLPSRYFYDAKGSRLFQQIMDLPAYYLTRCEYEVLSLNKKAIAQQLAQDGFFHLIDLGAGDALKTKLLLQELASGQSAFAYVPVDISGDAIKELSDSLQQNMPQLSLQGVIGEYFSSLDWLHHHKEGRKVVLFLGSNIGNFEQQESLDFLGSARSYLQPGDKLLLGVDLQKDPGTILAAYNDAEGVTAAFNLNLLHRINRELGGEFDVQQFCHHALYDPQAGVMRSYLVSQKAQQVYIRALGQSFHFAAWEAIHTESSHKYTLNQIAALGNASGFRVDTIFQDGQKRFADVLFAAV